MVTVADLPVLPALVDGTVWHRRHRPIDRQFRHHLYQWLVDVDDVPNMPWYLRPFARIDARDHIGGRDGSTNLRANVDRYLAGHGIDLGSGRIVMLANARIAGHVFDPLSVFWCFDAAGTLACVIAEVHNTYGDWHAYLLHPDGAGMATAVKQMYVSPFSDVSGDYRMRFDLHPQRVDVQVALIKEGAVELEAGFRGATVTAVRATIAKTVMRRPLMTHKISALIRAHGIALWLRRLGVQPRPLHAHQDGV
jgi:DUF1365 family protein